MLEKLLSWSERLGVLRWLKRWLLRDEERQHDRSVFQESDELLSHQQLMGFLQDLGNAHGYSMRDSNRVDRWLHFFDDGGRAYLIAETREAQRVAGEQLDRLMAFVALNFFVVGGDPSEAYGLRLRMQPELRNHAEMEGERRYAELAQQLRVRVRRAGDAFRDYRDTVRRSLMV